MQTILGYRYQIYDDSILKIYRLVRYINEDTVVLKEEGNPENTIKIPAIELNDKYVKLIPDAFMNIMLTDKTTDETDVYICVNKSSNLSAGKKTPDLICHQREYNYFKNMVADGKLYIGDCITDATAMEETPLSDYLKFKVMDETFSIALYVDDTIKSIIDAINPNIMKKINAQLNIIKSQVATIGVPVVGAMGTLEKLLVDTDFIVRFREIFNIAQIDIPIDDKQITSDGSIILNEAQKKFIEDMLRKYIHIVKVIRYAKDIDVSKIVFLKHVMISDESQTIYLVAYEEIGDYVIDDDIAKAMKVRNKNV